MTQTLTQDILKDINRLGRERPWRAHKMANEYLAMAYEDVRPDKAERLRACANELNFEILEDGRKKLRSAWFCRVRLCPMCTWRRSLKVAGQMKRIMDHIAATDKPLAYIFLTLTVKNCEDDGLSYTLTQILEAFGRLTKQKTFTDAVHGWYRGLEVTHNLDTKSKNYNTYHPHIHAVLAVNQSYFKGRQYISQATWSEMWRKSLRVDYSLDVDVRKVKGDTAAAVAEAAKYSVKASDILVPDDWDLTVNTLRVLDAALDKRRLVAFGGIFKEIHAQLQLDDAEEGDLVKTSEDPDAGSSWRKYTYAWDSGYRQYGRISE